MHKQTIIYFLFYLALFSLAANTANARGAQQMLGKDSPSFNLFDVKGEIHSIKQWRGKVVMINFWATWCTPCKKEIPLLNDMQSTYEQDEFQIVGIAIDNSLAVQEFNQSIPIDYINLLGGKDGLNLVRDFGNNIGVLPYTIIIDRNGKIVEIASGLLTRKYLTRKIEKYL